MKDNCLENKRHIHFIGIGGAGMSALAYVLVKRGYKVSGSDLSTGHMAAQLEEQGAIVYKGHAASQIEGADAVVVSTAINSHNVELVAAEEQGIPVLHRSDILAAIINKPGADGVAVAGAHGKTTTSAMISCMATEGGADPTVVIGGEVASLGGNARNGEHPYVVAEADESDGSFLKFRPQLAVITNIENDHLDHYGTEENIYQAFKQFVGNIRKDGKAILCVDNVKIRRLISEINTPYITYGMEGSGAEYVASDIQFGSNGTTYKIMYGGELLCEVRLLVPGRHNVRNSLGAFVAGREMGLDTASMVATLAKFGGAKRRFETKGKVNGIWVVDDYAHHPTEIGVTLSAARQTRPQRLIVVFQPHRYSRTKLLYQEFCNCFGKCDELILTDIYAASENPLPGISSAKLAGGITTATGQAVTYLPTLAEVRQHLEEIVQVGDLVMTIGAGDVVKVGEELVKELERKNAKNN